MAPFGDRNSEFQAGFTRLAGRKGVKSIALLSCDNEGTLAWTDMNRKAAQLLGIKIVYDQKYAFANVEFSSLLRAIDAAHPEAVYVASYPNETSAILRGMGELGIGDEYKLFGGGLIGLQSGSLLQSLGPAVNVIVNFNTYVPERSMQFPGTDWFFGRYYQRAKALGIDPLGFYIAPFAFAQGETLEQSVKGTGSLQGPAIASYMHSNPFSTIVGTFSFGPTGEWKTPRVLQTQFRGVKSGIEQFRRPGIQIILDPVEYATGDVLMPLGAART